MSSRLAIINEGRCKPSKCSLECKKICPVVQMGNQCIEVTKQSSFAFISEILCTGCNSCVKKCPFDAISIINIPKSLEKEETHRYGPNSFKIHRLPVLKQSQILGLLGCNGLGKSTILKILGGKLKPNLGNYVSPPDWKSIINNYKGSEIQNYFTKLVNDKLKILLKPQYVDYIPKSIKGTVLEVISLKATKDINIVLDNLDLTHLQNRNIENLSGGELQRLAIAVIMSQDADVYMFDEMTSYLDIKQRIKCSKLIRSLIEFNKYIVIVEHDLSILDYLSDFICCIYGKPSVYGVITAPFSTKEGINNFLAGYIPTENLRFREEELNFELPFIEDINSSTINFTYPNLEKSFDGFNLKINNGVIYNSEIIVLLGENGMGKTTFMRIIAGLLKDDNNTELDKLTISYKPQIINPKYNGSVRDLLYSKLGNMFVNAQFNSDVMKPLNIKDLFDLNVQNLSGGELQKVALILCLGKPADIYLLDEPSTYLDVEQRLIVSKIIKKYIFHIGKSAFIIEHDFMMATYLANRIIVFDGIPGINSICLQPIPIKDGLNKFLKTLDITFRKDPISNRARINKLDSVLDKEQKLNMNYYDI